MNRKITIFIQGLDCEDEAKIVRSKMEGLKGVVSFEINTVRKLPHQVDSFKVEFPALF